MCQPASKLYATYHPTMASLPVSSMLPGTRVRLTVTDRYTLTTLLTYRHHSATRSGIVCCMSGGGWRRWWGGAVVAAICAGGAFIAQVQVGDRLSAWASWTITLGGATATMLAVLLPARQTLTEVQAREAAEQLAKTAVTNYRLTLRSILLPLTDIFDRIITAPNEKGRMEAKGAMKQAVVNSVVQFTDVPRARSCYFDYEHSGKKGKLACRIYAGRDSRPRTEFSSADPNHAEIFQLLESRQSELIENTDIGNPPRFLFNGDCKTYISVPVATSTEIFGLLTLDALHAEGLEPQHEKEMLLLAQLLGIALASGGSIRSGTNNIAAAGGRRFARLVRSVTRRGNSTA